MENCMICRKVAMAKEGQSPALIHEFKHSYLVVGDHQYFKGYSQILLKEHARELHELSSEVQSQLFQELMMAGKAVFNTFQPWKMNYSCYGNVEPHIHWHIFPRYQTDPDHKDTPWLHSADFGRHLISEADRAETIARIRSELQKLS